jgi:hypothetical protein
MDRDNIKRHYGVYGLWLLNIGRLSRYPLGEQPLIDYSHYEGEKDYCSENLFKAVDRSHSNLSPGQ